MTATDLLTRHCQIVARRLGTGSVIPFLGAGANLCDRPADVSWPSDGFLPSGDELATYLAGLYSFPEDNHELLRVAQWIDLQSPRALVDELHDIFTRPCAPNSLHRFLAQLPATLRAEGRRICGQLILTANYDDVLERAFAEATEPVDVVVFESRRNDQRFVHLRPDGERVPIVDPALYREFALEQRSVILKIHGDVDPDELDHDTFVVTEDHYIDYLAGEGVRSLIPAYLMRRIRESDLLFLGYSMRDWNLRVILRQIWAEQGIRTGGWSIQRNPGEIDKRFWARQQIEILDVPLEDWVEGMRAQAR
ncbi:MAG TPA: SIR2 family protein [Solirubrobacteraceae bacterium]|nr:SIR2 family protein [Solirubrobacteraceae bacterium]